MVTAAHSQGTPVWVRGPTIDAVVQGKNGSTKSKRSFASKKMVKSVSSASSSGGSEREDDPVIIRTAAPWTWKRGVMTENSATDGIVLRLTDTDEEIRLPPTAFKTGDVLYSNSYPKAKDGSTVIPEDLISLTHLHEPSVIECLLGRYEKDSIYTYTGPILLALNPFRNLHHLYSDAIMKTYWHHAEQNTDDYLPPHVYAVADATFRGMMRKLEMSDKEKPVGCDQSILVSGESGAGKTVTMKFAMKYLAALSQRLAEFHAKHGKPSYLGIRNKNSGDERSHVQGRTHTDPLALRGHTFAVKSQPSSYSPVSSPQKNPEGESLSSQSSLTLLTDSIEAQVLQSNPILESFGNARTVRNDNSSRFGKFIELQFTRYGKLVGAQIQTYLLEKVRIIKQSLGERNYHIFFEIMSGGLDFRVLKDFYLTSKHTPLDFKITANGAYDRRDGVPDSDTYRELRRAMNVMKFSPDVQKNVFNVTAAILHASNLTWVEKHGDEAAVDESNEHLDAVCHLLGITPANMTQSLCYSSITVGNNEVRKSLNKEKSEHGFEALLKALYNALFLFLVRKINNSIAYKKDPGEIGAGDPMRTPATFIGILDIFGFESFQTNSFEQLCINYCNETLQMQFSSFILKNEQKEYEKEEIRWDFIDFSENQDVLDLIEKRGTGIFGILDDMCRTGGTTDRVFADTLYKKCESSACFSADKKQFATLKFTVLHYAGPVEYTAEGFVEKNRDELPNGSTEFLRKSDYLFVQELAEIIEGSVNVSNGSGGDKSRKSVTTVGGHFKDQLKDLRSKVEKTSPHYIRCLKPNDLLVPNRFETPIVAEQLRCGGVLEAVRVARAGFPQHYPHGDFIARYRPLVWREWKTVIGQSKDKPDVCRKLIDVLFHKLQKLEQAEQKIGESEPSDAIPFVKLGMQMGKTKVFLRQREFEGLERQRGQEQQKAAIKLNATFRGYLVRLRWADYVPLLRKKKSDYLKDREKKLLEEMYEKQRVERDLADLASVFSGSCEQLLSSSEREMVASKVGSRNPRNRADLVNQGPRGSFKWVVKGGAWVKKYSNENPS